MLITTNNKNNSGHFCSTYQEPDTILVVSMCQLIYSLWQDQEVHTIIMSPLQMRKLMRKLKHRVKLFDQELKAQRWQSWDLKPDAR